MTIAIIIVNDTEQYSISMKSYVSQYALVFFSLVDSSAMYFVIGNQPVELITLA